MLFAMVMFSHSRLHLLAILFLTVLILDETLGAYQKSSKEGKKKKKTEGDSKEAKKRYDGSNKEHKKRKIREVPVEVEEEIEADPEIEVREPYKSSKESKKQQGKEVKAEKYNKKKKQYEEEAYITKEKKKADKKYTESKQKKQYVEELEPEIDIENAEPEEEIVYVTKEKKKSKKAKKEERKQKYNGIIEEESVDEPQEHPGCVAEEDVELETDVVEVPSKKRPRVQRYIIEETEEGNEIESVPAEKCYYK